MDIVKLAILCLTCGAGFMVLSYEQMAIRRGWTVGIAFRLSNFKTYIFTKLLLTLAIILWVGSPIISLFVNSWYSALIVVVAGFALPAILTNIFKVYSQFLSLILLVLSYALLLIQVFL